MFAQFSQRQFEEHTICVAKHSQYSFKQLDFLQLQPFPFLNLGRLLGLLGGLIAFVIAISLIFVMFVIFFFVLRLLLLILFFFEIVFFVGDENLENDFEGEENTEDEEVERAAIAAGREEELEEEQKEIDIFDELFAVEFVVIALVAVEFEVDEASEEHEEALETDEQEELFLPLIGVRLPWLSASSRLLFGMCTCWL